MAALICTALSYREVFFYSLAPQPGAVLPPFVAMNAYPIGARTSRAPAARSAATATVRCRRRGILARCDPPPARPFLHGRAALTSRRDDGESRRPIRGSRP